MTTEMPGTPRMPGAGRIGRTTDLAACHAIRRAVFMDEQGVSEADEMDDRDDGAIHLLAVADEAPVGTARLLLAPPVGKIGRVAVLRSHRGGGIGRGLITAALDILRAEGMTQAVLGAQVDAIGFYAPMGFAAEGDVFDDAGIPHRWMARPL